MIRKNASLLRFARREDGSMVIEFALWFPIFVALMGATIELGMIGVRHMMLERGLDIAVRQVKLNTGNPPQHDDLKEFICQEAAVIPDCLEVLKLEMRPLSLRDWAGIPAQADCVDRSQEVQPAAEYVPGAPHELMILRACAKFTPIFPTTAIGASLALDNNDEYALVARNAFVQEPN